MKISCKADIEVLQAEPFVPFQDAENHPAMALTRPCEIPAKLGLPILMQSYPTEGGWENNGSVDQPYTNHLAKCLMIVPGSTDPEGGRGLFQMVPGTVMVMREDRRTCIHIALKLCAITVDISSVCFL